MSKISNEQNELEKAYDYYYNYSMLSFIISDKYDIPLEDILLFIFNDFKDKHKTYFDIIFDHPDRKMNIKILKQHLSLRNIKKSGNKDELINRLIDNIEDIKKNYFTDFNWEK